MELIETGKSVETVKAPSLAVTQYFLAGAKSEVKETVIGVVEVTLSAGTEI